MAAAFDEEPLDIEEAPRRRASARLNVDAEIGSAAAMREAMDPANQSLADALRLSYRVLQAAIVVLVAMFLVSGIQLVRQGQSGVMTRFGKIVSDGGDDALQAGRRWSVLPYPAGDFMIFDVENRSVSTGGAFWPRIPQGKTLDQAIEGARTSAGLRPGDDGSVISAGGDLAHLQVTARYKIADPVGFATRLRDGDADRVVRLALQRAVVEVCARSTLQEIVEQSDDLKRRVQQSGQVILDELESGIELAEVDLPDTKPPFAIVKAYGDLRNAREEALRRIASAQSAAQTTLDKTTANHAELSRLIGAYEQAEDVGDAELAARQLAIVNDALEGEQTTGDVSFVIGRAKAYESEIESTLGLEVSRFLSVLPAYRRNPGLEVRRRWIEAYLAVLGRNDLEIFYVPAGLERLSVNIKGLEAVQKLKGENRINRLRAESLKESVSQIQKQLYYDTADLARPGEARPSLEVIDGRVVPEGIGELTMVALDREIYVEAVGLTKTFKDFWMRTKARAVDNVDLRIGAREIFGLLGPNGSGKSTIIKMILGLLHPTRGRLTVLGRAPTDVAIKRRIGFLPEESYLYRFLNPRETLDYYGRLFSLDGRTRRRRIDELLDMVGLTHVAHRPIGEFSKGMTRRVGLAQALINDPDLLILDEPTSGMDPIGTRQVKDLLLELGRRGKTILLSSHLLADVEDVCDRMVMLYAGRIRAEGTVDELLRDTQRTVIEAARLAPETISRIERVIFEAEGKGIDRVEAPRQRLEQFFMDLVEKARAEQIETSGATHGGQTAKFLRAEEERGAELIDTLTRATEAERGREAVAAAAPRQARDRGTQRNEVLSELIEKREPAAPPAPKGGRAAEPPREADKSVIDSLMDEGTKARRHEDTE